MKILITGGAGFIGSSLIRFIIKNTSDNVINVDDLTYAGNLENLTSVSDSSRYAFFKIDICDTNSLIKVFEDEKPDAVMHLAAESHVDRSIEGPMNFVSTNVVGTCSILSAALSYWKKLDPIRQKEFRFHHISTDEVYGDLPHPDDVGVPGSQLPKFTELTPYKPSSPYSASKAASDLFVRSWQRTYDFPIVITNCSNNYGPYHFPEKLIPHIIISAIQGKDLPVYGKGDQIRDWLYVDDHAKALYCVLNRGEVGQTYNIGGENEVKNLDVVHEICEILQELKPSNINYKDLIKFVNDRPGHDRRYAIDSSKINNELGWSPEETFKTGLRKTVQWYLDNTFWWERVISGEYKLSRIGDIN